MRATGTLVVAALVVSLTTPLWAAGGARWSENPPAASTVDTTSIQDGAVTSAKLATNGVAGSNLQAGSVSSSMVVVGISSTQFQSPGTITSTAVDGSTKTASAMGSATDDVVTLEIPTGVTKVMVAMSATMWDSASDWHSAALYVDGVLQSNFLAIQATPYQTYTSLTGIVAVTAGATRTFEMRYSRSGTAGTHSVRYRRLQVWAVGN